MQFYLQTALLTTYVDTTCFMKKKKGKGGGRGGGWMDTFCQPLIAPRLWEGVAEAPPANQRSPLSGPGGVAIAGGGEALGHHVTRGKRSRRAAGRDGGWV